MAKTEDLIIKDFQKGMAPSPHLGFAEMRNVDIWSEPGIAKIAFSSTKKSSTTITGYPRWTSPDASNSLLTGAYVYFFDDDNKVYSSTYGETSYTNISGNTQTNGTGDGFIWWKNHLFAIRDTAWDVYKISSTTWYNSWASTTLITGNGYHPAVAGQDDILYVGHGNKVASVTESGTFDANNSGTYTVNTAALTLPAGYQIKSMVEYGKYLAIGTWQGYGIGDKRIADIFLWDRSSTSFNLPIRLQENGVNCMIAVGNLLYIQAGVYGNWYVSNGSSVQFFRNIPRHLFDFTSAKYVKVEPNAAFHRDNKIFFGLSTGSGTSLSPMGIWSMDLSSGAMVVENIISTGNTSNLKIGTLYSNGTDAYIAGWEDTGATAQGVDEIGNSNRYTSYAAYIISPLIEVGTRNNKRTFTGIEPVFTKPLASGEGVRLSYRKDLSNSFTTIGTVDYATHGATMGEVLDANIVDAQHVQIKVELTNTGSTTPHLKEIRLR